MNDGQREIFLRPRVQNAHYFNGVVWRADGIKEGNQKVIENV